MSDSFLDTEETLQSLITELKKFRAASEQLTIAEGNAGNLLNACGRLIHDCEQLIEQCRTQSGATARLADRVEQRTNLLVAEQKVSVTMLEEKLNSLADSMETSKLIVNNVANTLNTHSSKLNVLENSLQGEVKQSLQRLQRIGSWSRAVVFVLVVLGLANSAALAYIIQYLMSRA